MAAWQQLKERIDAETERIWLNEPDEMKIQPKKE